MLSQNLEIKSIKLLDGELSIMKLIVDDMQSSEFDQEMPQSQIARVWSNSGYLWGKYQNLMYWLI